MRTTSIYVTHDQVEAMTLAERIVVLSAGRVMQVGTPDEIYNRPASRFVAGFTGSPPMNFLAAEVLECTAGRCALRLAGSAVSLYGQFRAQAGDAVTLGVRPEDVGLAAPGATSVPLAGEVVVLEPLGAETQATIRCAAGELVARLPAQVSLSAGTAVTVWFDPGKVHLFSNASGESLRV
jgi:multiple sugar transport system ATP-binding protein